MVTFGATEAAHGRAGQRAECCRINSAPASIHGLQLPAYEPCRDVVAELGPESLRWSDHRRQRLNLNDDANGTWLDGPRAKRLDKPDLRSDRKHDLATMPPLSEASPKISTKSWMIQDFCSWK
jgi:hypothetical protein